MGESEGGRDAQLKHTGLRPGWTTGACATAAATAAYTALLTGDFPDPVTITLPKGQTPAFALAVEELAEGRATAGVVKDAGDDPDVTHGALVRVTVRRLPPGSGVVFRAGPGVGTVTLPGLPLDVGELTVNPVPRRMIGDHIARVAAEHRGSGDVEVTVSVDDGEEIARSTWNPRLGILGGLSILGTTGVVVPYSCSAWIDSIRRGVDVARAAGHTHVAGCTGSTSEKTVVSEYGLPEIALLDMGDFAGAVLKYVRRHPVDRLTVCGGFAKLSKLAMRPSGPALRPVPGRQALPGRAGPARRCGRGSGGRGGGREHRSRGTPAVSRAGCAARGPGGRGGAGRGAVGAAGCAGRRGRHLHRPGGHGRRAQQRALTGRPAGAVMPSADVAFAGGRVEVAVAELLGAQSAADHDHGGTEHARRLHLPGDVVEGSAQDEFVRA